MEGGGDTVPLARVNLRQLARQVEETAIALREAGYKVVPGELMAISQRLTECREVLERVNDPAK